MTNFDYTSRDYLSIQNDLLERASQVLPSWTSRDPSDFGMLMVDLWAYMGDVLHYYIDRAAGEANLETATQRESVISIANLLDYIPGGRSPASGSVTLDASGSSATDASPIIIPKYWKFVATPKTFGASDLIFSTDYAVAINTSGPASPVTVDGVTYTTVAKGTPFTVNVTEGERYEEYFTSTGLSGQRILLANTGVVASSIEVSVSEGSGGSFISYSYVDRLLEASSTQRSFTPEYTAADRVYLNFGNGVNGAIPLVNAQIKVNYRRSRGLAGNIPAYSIRGFDTTILPNGSTLSGITVTGNTSATVGGSDAESMLSMKANIPLSFRTQDRAVSLQDYQDLTLRVPGIVKAKSKMNSGTVDIYAVANQGNYESRTLSASSIALGSKETEIEDYLLTRSIAGVTYDVKASVTLQPVRITLSVLRILDGYIQEKVEDEVRAAIANLFTFDNVSFGQQLSLGTLYRTVLAVSGVDYATVTQFTTTTGASTIDSSGSFTGVTADDNKLLYLATDAPVVITLVSGGIVASGA